MDIKEAIEGIFTGESILFVGSGFSFGAKNSHESDNSIKSSSDLSKALLSECGIKQDGVSLTKASTVYIERQGADRMTQFLKKEFCVSSISPDHEYLLGYKWLRVYTTNYDDIIELGYAKNRKTSTPVTLSSNYQEFRSKMPNDLIVHLNGYIRTLSSDKLNNEFKLTNASYLATTFKQSPWLDLLNNDLRICKSIFFVGFSMDYDLDLSQIIAGVGLKDKAFFIVADDIDDIDVICLSSYGTVQPIRLDGFVRTIKEIHSKYSPRAIAETFSPISFRELRLDKSNVHVSSNDFYEMLIGGYVRPSLLQRGLEDENFQYAVSRTALQSAIMKITSNKKHVLVESSLGNGKTVFLQQLAIKLLIEKKQVFWFEKHTDKEFSEVGIIVKKYPEAIIILDDYHTARDVIKSIVTSSDTNIVITSERRSYHDAIYDDIQQVLGNYETISIDRLDMDESIAINNLFSKYSIWGSLSAMSEEERLNYFRNYCKSQISLLVLSQIHDSHVSQKLFDAFGSIKSEPKYKRAVIVILLIEYFRLKNDMYDYTSWIGAEILNNPLFRNNIGIKEFVSFEDSEVRFKSSIVSQYFLHRFITPEEIVDTLIDMMRILDNTASANRNHKAILTTLLNYTQLRNCINSTRPGTLQHILRFYETVQQLPMCAENIHFWLQYAIARLDEKNYQVARLYFEKCYALAQKRPGYLTYKIDNHYSRYMLENAIENNLEQDCMDIFRRAHKILIVTNHGEEKTIYPYRMAGLYVPYYQHFYRILSDTEKREFLEKCSEMRDKCNKFINEMAQSPYLRDVQEIEKKLSQILKENSFVRRNGAFKYGVLKK